MCSYWVGTRLWIFAHTSIVLIHANLWVRWWYTVRTAKLFLFFSSVEFTTKHGLKTRIAGGLKPTNFKYRWRDINTLSVEQHVCHQWKSFFNTSEILLGILIFASMRSRLSASQLSARTSELLEWTSIQLYNFREKIHSLSKRTQRWCKFSEKLC